MGMALLLAPLSVCAQNKTVKGTVLDENGEPIIGATIQVVGDKSAGTVTDLDGNYEISVPSNAKVNISYIGYLTQTVKPGGTVQMQEDLQSLEEVVVVGSGRCPRGYVQRR